MAMKRLAGLTAMGLASCTLAGCSSLLDKVWGENGFFRDRSGDYLESQETAQMRVPANLETRPIEPLLPIPERVALPRNTDNYYVPRPQKLVMAQGSDFSISVAGEERWLVAQRTPARLWLSTRAFIEDAGFRIAAENPNTGELDTAWQSGSDYRVSELSSAASSETQSRVRIRIEPGVQNNTSEVYVLSDERESSAQTNATIWPLTTSNRKLDAALLTALKDHLSRDADGDTVSLMAERDYDAPTQVNLIEDANGTPLLHMETDFNRAWSRLGRALEASDVLVEDINRSLGLFYVNLAERAEANKGEPSLLDQLLGTQPDEAEIEARAERYLIRLVEVNNGMQVSVEEEGNALAPPDVARRVLTMLKDNLAWSRPGEGGPAGGPPAGGDRPSGGPPGR